jgi:hypothetical protein
MLCLLIGWGGSHVRFGILIGAKLVSELVKLAADELITDVPRTWARMFLSLR